jgi:hypothetical protein
MLSLAADTPGLFQVIGDTGTFEQLHPQATAARIANVALMGDVTCLSYLHVVPLLVS